MTTFNVSRDKAVELVMKRKNQSKSSSKQPINQAALTNILDKLSNKFGISWKYDTSIPGFRTSSKDGVVLINPNKAKLDTPFHEFAHPFIAIIKVQNPLLYKNLVSQISKTEIGRSTFEKVKKLYPELTYEQQLEETIVDLIGQYAADQQSLKQEKGLWNAIKTFLRRVSEYLKSLLGNENKKVIPSELDPNTSMEELSSMLVIDNPIDLGTMLGKGYKKPSIKPGVQELFESNPELASIGTLEQYSQYLDSIFPDSKVKDIVYHATNSSIDSFDKSKISSNTLNYGFYGKGFYFNETKNDLIDWWKSLYKKQPNIVTSILNVENPYNADSKDIEEQTKLGNKEEAEEFTNNLVKNNYDSVLPQIPKEEGSNEYVVFEPEQIHILGSKQDIEGFKEFASNPVQRVNLDKPTTLFNIFANVADSDVIELINNCN